MSDGRGRVGSADVDLTRLLAAWSVPHAEPTAPFHAAALQPGEAAIVAVLSILPDLPPRAVWVRGAWAELVDPTSEG